MSNEKKKSLARTSVLGSAKLPAEGEAGPSYRNPPVDEVVCGIRFELLADFKVPHIGLFWTKLRDRYPKIEHAAPLALGGNLVVDAASGAPLPRMWFVSASDGELVQFQTDQLYFNWRRRETDYPRFRTLFPKFEAAKHVLDELLKELGSPPLVIQEHELTYINRIPQGDGWESIVDLSNVLTYFSWSVANYKYLREPRNLAWTMRFPLPADQGHMDVKLSLGTRRTDKRRVLLLHLSAKGKAIASSWESSQAWFRTAHDYIVNGFSEITSSEVQQKVWQREDI